MSQMFALIQSFITLICLTDLKGNKKTQNLPWASDPVTETEFGQYNSACSEDTTQTQGGATAPATFSQ